MKDLKLTIQINKPVKDVFEFALNPKNTPKWIDGIIKEQTNEWPAKLGSIYRNQNTAGQWREFEITTFEQDKSFVLSEKDGLRVGYEFATIDLNTTELTYSLWVNEEELKVQITTELLKKLKQVIEES